MGTDKMIPKYAYNKSFTVRFLDRCEWKDGLGTDRKGGIIWYTDGSTTAKALHHYGTKQKLSFSLEQYTSVPGRLCHLGPHTRTVPPSDQPDRQNCHSSASYLLSPYTRR
jgi:hypothetical protein